jgi:hypothetical protein
MVSINEAREARGMIPLSIEPLGVDAANEYAQYLLDNDESAEAVETW